MSGTVNLLMSGCDTVFHLAAAVGVQLIVDLARANHPQHNSRHRSRARRSPAIFPPRAHHQLVRSLRQVEPASRSARMTTSSSARPCRPADGVMPTPARASMNFWASRITSNSVCSVTIVRLFNTVGPRQVGMYGMVLPRFVAAALKNAPIQGSTATAAQTLAVSATLPQCHRRDKSCVSWISPSRSGRCSISAATRKYPSKTSPAGL